MKKETLGDILPYYKIQDIACRIDKESHQVASRTKKELIAEQRQKIKHYEYSMEQRQKIIDYLNSIKPMEVKNEKNG